jgi:hypothetical protein
VKLNEVLQWKPDGVMSGKGKTSQNMLWGLWLKKNSFVIDENEIGSTLSGLHE